MKPFWSLLLAACLIVHAGRADVKFLRGPLRDAIEQAKTEKKPVLIDFYTDWCRWCDTLDARTYSDNAVASCINSQVVPIKIDAEKGEGIDIAKKYAVRGFPTTLLIDADGEEIDRIVGFVPPEKFLPDMNSMLKGDNTLKSVRARIQEKPNDPATRYMAAQKHAARYEPALAAEQYRKLLELDPNNLLGHNEEARFEVALASLQEKRTSEDLLAFLKEYPASKQTSRAYGTLYQFYLRAKDSTQALSFFRQYIEREPSDAMAMNNFAWESATQKNNLAYAAQVAAQAVALATKDGDRAMFLDTQATVEFVRGNVERAIALEQQALELLSGAPAKARKEYEDSLAKFKVARPSAPGK